MKLPEPRLLKAGLALLLVLTGLAVYIQVRGFQFLSFDDPAYFTENHQVRSGLSWLSARWAMTTFAAANWHPLTWLSLLADVSLFGLNPGPHHLMNVAWHLLNSVLCFYLLSALTGSTWRSALVAALFALHPCHVESVAWIAERKDVLSTCFWFLTTFAYMGYVRRPSRGRYGLMLLLFALGLMAKPMLVTLPITLILLDGWPLGRIKTRRDLLTSLWEKLPLFLLVVAACLITLLAQGQGGAMSPLSAMSVSLRISNALLALVRYLGMLVWPVGLAPFYPFQAGGPPLWQPLAAAVLLTAVTVLALLQARKRPYLLMGWAWFLITLVPVIGLVQVGSQTMADRYTYLPFLGPFIMIAWGLGEAVNRLKLPHWVPAAAAALWLGLLSVQTTRQVSHWRDTFTLFSHARQITGNTPLACVAMGHAYIEAGRFPEAVAEYRSAVQLSPNYLRVRYSLGRALVHLGQHEEAIQLYRELIQKQPKEMAAHFHLAQVLEEAGRTPEAIQEYRLLLAADLPRLGEGVPDQDMAFSVHFRLGLLLWARRDFPEAGQQFLEATLLAPLGPDPRTQQANDYAARALLVLGRPQAAADLWRRGLALNPKLPQTHYSLGLALVQAGQPLEAGQAFRQALVLDPAYEAAREQLAALAKAPR